MKAYHWSSGGPNKYISFYDEVCLDYTVSTVNKDVDDDDVEDTDTPLPDVYVQPSTLTFYKRNHREVSAGHLLNSVL